MVDPNPFTAVDRELLKRCLGRAPGSWNDFVDRFLSLIYHVIGYTAHLRSTHIGPEDVEDIAAEVLLKIVGNDFRVLREFRGHSSLATYLTVVSRRICIQELARRQKNRSGAAKRDDFDAPDTAPAALKGMESLDEVEQLLKSLSGKEREIVRLYYLEGRTYEEISTETEVPVNTIGAVLSRARKKLRESAAAQEAANPKKSPPRSGAHPRSGALRKPPPQPVSDEDEDAPTPASKPAMPPVTPRSGAVRKVATPPTAEAGTPSKPTKPVKPVKPVPEDADDE
ncbi:MAG: sigma-70 family RNA polymerase sigma factor [Planctomycetaceae bacterium]|nr:sigma-70 family RNA polymerase sigma factor [Planctomycetaceae bacterium]